MRLKRKESDARCQKGTWVSTVGVAGSAHRWEASPMVRYRVFLALVAIHTLAVAFADSRGDLRMPMIVVVKGHDHLRKLREMCLERIGDNGEGAALFHGLSDECRVAGACKRIFTASIKGVSGDFTNTQLDIIERCLPDGIKYLEADGAVSRTEDGYSEANKPLSYVDVQSSGNETILNSSLGSSFPSKDDVLKMGKLVHAFDGPDDGSSSPQQEMRDDELARIVSSEGTKAQSVHAALWNLDRVDQRDLPLNKEFRYGSLNVVGTGRGVTVFILDSGIRPSHQEFLEWNTGETRAKYGYDFVEDDPISEDCDGHGTHVASTAIGRAVGIAKQSHVVSVRVLDCHGSGNISTTVAGLDWVASNYKKPGVVALSLGVAIGKWSRTLEDTVKSLIQDHGLTVVVASGNSGVDSCYVAPANVPETITVAASDLDTKFGITAFGEKEGIYRWSNTGPCVDVFAPGVDIYAACGGVGRCIEVTDDAYTWASGTSMAVPHVAGVAAMYLGEHPDAPPAAVKQAIVGAATKGKIQSPLLKPGTPNRLLYSNVFEA